MNEMIERIGIAISKANSELHNTYGVFDYSSYGKTTKSHVVRDFTNRDNQIIGEFDTSEEAHEFYIKTCKAYLAKAAVKAMREPTDKMIEAGIINYKDDPNFKCATHKSYVAMIDEILK